MNKARTIFLPILILILVLSSCNFDTPLATYEHNEDILTDVTWRRGRHKIIDELYIDNATLTIEAGSIIEFEEGGGLTIGYDEGNSTLIAIGDKDDPITFTSSSSNKGKGDWGCLWFDDGATTSCILKYCNIEYGGGYLAGYGAIVLSDAEISIENCTIKNSDDHGVSLHYNSMLKSFTNNTIFDIDDYPVYLPAESVHMVGTGNEITSSLGIAVTGGDIEERSVTLREQSCPYVILNNISVGSTTGTTLNIEPGVSIEFAKGIELSVGSYGTFGTILAEGTVDKKITFTSAAHNKSAGDWDGIYMYSGTSNSTSFEYCDFQYGGGYSEYYGMLHLDETSVSVENCSFMFSEYSAIILDDEASFVSFKNNTISNSGDGLIEIYGNYAHTIGTGNTLEGTNFISIIGDYIESSGTLTWNKQTCPYLIKGNQYIGSSTGTSLIIEAGTTIQFAAERYMTVGGYAGTGKLVAQGDASNLIIFTSAARAFSSPGDWDGIYFNEGTASGSILDYCVVDYSGGYGSDYGAINVDGTSNVTISNSTIQNSQYWGIYIEPDASATLTNNTYANNGSGDVYQ